MKTITKLSQVSEILTGESFELDYNNFKVRNFEYIKFQIELSNIHIQALLNLGIVLDFSSKKKSNCRNSNEFVMYATASISALKSLDDFSRENHLRQVSMINNHQIVASGFPLKGMTIENGKLSYGVKISKSEALISHIEKIEAIRKEVRKRYKRETNVYTTRCSIKKLDY